MNEIDKEIEKLMNPKLLMPKMYSFTEVREIVKRMIPKSVLREKIDKSKWELVNSNVFAGNQADHIGYKFDELKKELLGDSAEGTQPAPHEVAK